MSREGRQDPRLGRTFGPSRRGQSTIAARVAVPSYTTNPAAKMSSESASEITALLQAHAAGDASALGLLLPRVYQQLRRMARSRLRRERVGHTLAATELVHEAFLKLVPLERVDWRSRAHFYAIASRAMRNVLVDHAVRRGAAKRDGGAQALPLDENSAVTEQPLDDLDRVERRADSPGTDRRASGSGGRMPLLRRVEPR